MTRAAAYARYSTSRQKETSIAAQLKAIQGYCKHKGYQLVGMPYVDEARSGTNVSRTAFQDLLEDARLSRFDVIVVYDLSRGARDIADWFAFRKEMAIQGIQVESATGGIGDIEDPSDFLQESVQAAVGQFMVMQSRQKSIAAKTIRAERGLFGGGIPPLGYDIVDGRYVINAREAPVIRTIFTMYAQGSSYTDIMYEVDKSGVRGKRGQRLTKNTLHYILKNERYAGTFIWNEYTMRHMHTWVGKKNEEYVRIENAIPAIIDKHTFDAVARRMAKNKKNTLNNTRVKDRHYLLSGIIRCAECGASMAGTTTTSKGYQYKRYTCITRHKLKSCALRDIKADALEAHLVGFIRQRILKPEAISGMLDIIYANDSTAEADAIAQEILTLEGRIAKLYDAIERGLNTELAIDRIHQNNDKKQALQQRLANLPKSTLPDRALLAKLLRQDMDAAFDSPQQSKQLLQRYIKSIQVSQQEIHVTIAPDLSAFTLPLPAILTIPDTSKDPKMKKTRLQPRKVVNGTGSRTPTPLIYQSS